MHSNRAWLTASTHSSSVRHQLRLHDNKTSSWRVSLEQLDHWHPPDLPTHCVLTFTPTPHVASTEIKWNKPLNNHIRTASIWSLLSETAIFDFLHGTISPGWRREQIRGKAALLRLLCYISRHAAPRLHLWFLFKWSTNISRAVIQTKRLVFIKKSRF